MPSNTLAIFMRNPCGTDLDPPDDRDCTRVAALAQIEADNVAGRDRQAGGNRQPAGMFEMAVGRHPAAVRAPNCNGERQHEIVVFATPGVITTPNGMMPE